MSDMIRRSDVIRALGENAAKQTREAYDNYGHGRATGIVAARDLVRNIPAVDAVEVVRKPVKGYEGYYEVDNLARVYSVDREVTVVDGSRVYEKPVRGRRLSQNMHTKGYKTVSLTKNGKTKRMFVHRIVAEAFIPNPQNFPFVNHIDEDKTNNLVENLEWCTPQYNSTYGKAREKQAKKIRGIPHTEEHKKKIAASLKLYHQKVGQRREDGDV